MRTFLSRSKNPGCKTRADDKNAGHAGGVPRARQDAQASIARLPARVQVKDRNGVWELRVDGIFRGDYLKKEHAVAAVALANWTLR